MIKPHQDSIEKRGRNNLPPRTQSARRIRKGEEERKIRRGKEARDHPKKR